MEAVFPSDPFSDLASSGEGSERHTKGTSDYTVFTQPRKPWTQRRDHPLVGRAHSPATQPTRGEHPDVHRTQARQRQKHQQKWAGDPSGHVCKEDVRTANGHRRRDWASLLRHPSLPSERLSPPNPHTPPGPARPWGEGTLARCGRERGWGSRLDSGVVAARKLKNEISLQPRASTVGVRGGEPAWGTRTRRLGNARGRGRR